MGARSFDIAVEVLADGWRGDEALAEWIVRIESEGERFCPLAQELILSSGFMEVPLGEVEEIPAAEPPSVFDPFFDGQFAFPDVPGEPVE